MTAQDKEILRELARRHHALAQEEVNGQREARIRRINGLTPDRPPVWIDEIPWNEMDIDGQLALRCQDPLARGIEAGFRRTLFRWEHFQADMVVRDFFSVPKAYSVTGHGLEVVEQVIAKDRDNHIVSHHYEDQLDTEEKVESLKLPVVTALPQEDERNLELAHDLFDGILPVRLRGHGIYYAPWDEISRYRGVEPILMDMIDRPEFIHRTMEKFTRIYTSRFEQMEALGLLDWDVDSLHCTPPFVDELPSPEYDGTRTRFRDVWFRGMAQTLGSVSPAMYDEFDLQYSRRLMDRCGLSYYGCCEPLDKLIPWLKKIPNLRKIGVSPWADIRSSAEQMGGAYVFARKPNPALVASATFDEEAVEREIRETALLCREHGCPCEFVLKDISTVAYRPQNLILWNRTAQRVLDELYG